jgi:hypothetical protein
MAAFHGKVGSAVFAGLTFDMYSWSIDASADVAESTVMAEASGYKTYLAGFNNWTATAEVQLPAAGVGLAALGSSATLTMVGSTYDYVGTAICTGVSPAVDKDGVASASLSFQGSGVLTEAAV